jgi:hypothetical protein
MVSVTEFRETRRYVRENVGALIRAAIEAQTEYQPDQAVPLLAREGWLPDGPLPLTRIRFRWQDDAGADQALDEAKAAASFFWPPVSGAAGVPTNHGATEQYDRPGSFFNGLSYRLCGVDTDSGVDTDGAGLTLRICPGRYFDLYDTGEPLGYETGLLHKANNPHPLAGWYRRWLADPFDFTKRCAIPGINTLTVVRYSDGPHFIMHRRVGVGTADGTAHVIPAGEFQPHNATSLTRDLDIWHNIMREYTEELGGRDFAKGDYPIDYDLEEPCATLQRSRAAVAGLRVWFLGLGLYPLTWKPEILTVCVFDAADFRSAFPEIHPLNDEGIVILDDERVVPLGAPRGAKKGEMRGLRFDEPTVSRYRDADDTLPAARACLELAWRWREALGISG